MATSSEISVIADDMAARTNAARNSIPQSWYPQDKLPLVTKHMKTADAEAMAAAFDVPWVTAMAYGQSSSTRPSLGQTFFNYGAGWAFAGAQRIALLGQCSLRGVVYTNTLTLDAPIMTMPAILAPAQNEQFTVNALTPTGVAPVILRLYTDGVLALWNYGYAGSAYPTAITHLSLSGISYEGLY